MVLTALILVSDSAYAFDGHRRGFVAGLYVGAASISSSDRMSVPGGPAIGFAPSFRVGLGIADRTLIHLTVKPVIYSQHGSSTFVAFPSLGGAYYFGPGRPDFHIGLDAGMLLDGSHSYDGSGIAVGYSAQISFGTLIVRHLELELSLIHSKRFFDPDWFRVVSLSLGVLGY